jgi:hypothetical protein
VDDEGKGGITRGTTTRGTTMTRGRGRGGTAGTGPTCRRTPTTMAHKGWRH